MWYHHLSRIAHTLLSGPDRMLPRARLWSRPLRIHIAIHDFCNLKCPHCLREAPSVEIDRGKLQPEDFERLAPWFDSSMIVALAGLGEPFIQKNLFDVIRLIHERGSAASIITNATLLSEKTCRNLVEGGPLILNLSIDAGSKEVFERVRLGADFDKVVENVDRLVAMKRETGSVYPVLGINMTLMRDTLGEVGKVLELAHRWKVPQIVAQTVMYLKDSPDRSQAVTNREAQKALAAVRPRAEELGIAIRYVPLSSDYQTLIDDEAEGEEYAPSYPYQHRSKSDGSAHSFICPNLWHQMMVDVSGEMMYCCMADAEFQEKYGPIGNIKDQDPEKLWNHPKMVALRRSLLEGDPPEECRRCYALERFGRKKMLGMWRSELDSLRQMF